ncbi:MAG: PadR family transcriptional regulator [Acidimicrobiia bacterium]
MSERGSGERAGRGGHRRRHGGPPWEGRRRMRRGDIRTALLAVLAEGPGHGYDLMQTLEEKTGGAWRPSPGSVYPTLQLLEDEGLVRSVERDGKRIFEINEAGRTEVDRRIEAAGGTPWDVAGRTGGRGNEVREAMGMMFLAAKQISAAGDPERAERAAAIVNDARKKLYQLLAED